MTRHDPADLGHRLLVDVARLHRWASRHTEFDVPAAQLRLLALVDQLAPTRVGALAAADHSSQPTITAQLNRTEAAGLTRRTPDPADARAQVVELTAAGRAALVEARRARSATLAPALADWSVRDLDRLAEAVAVIGELVGDLEPTPSSPTTRSHA